MTSGQVDGSLRIRGRNILDLRLDSGDPIRQYLIDILRKTLLTNRGLDAPVRRALVQHGLVDEDDTERAGTLITEVMEVLSAEPFRPIGIKTDAVRRAAQLQRRHARGGT